MEIICSHQMGCFELIYSEASNKNLIDERFVLEIFVVVILKPNKSHIYLHRSQIGKVN